MMLFQGSFAWCSDSARVPASACVVIVASELATIEEEAAGSHHGAGTHPCIEWCRSSLGTEHGRWERAALPGADVIMFECARDAETFVGAFRGQPGDLAKAA